MLVLELPLRIAKAVLGLYYTTHSPLLSPTSFYRHRSQRYAFFTNIFTPNFMSDLHLMGNPWYITSRKCGQSSREGKILELDHLLTS